MCGPLQSGQKILLALACFDHLQRALMLECMRHLGNSELGVELSQNSGLAYLFPFKHYNLERMSGGGIHPKS